MWPKDTVHSQKQDRVVYKIPFECKKVYIGETGRCKHEQIEEHDRGIQLSQSKTSAIYIWTCQELLSQCMGSEFHSVIDLGKKENLKTSLETFGILYLKAWLLRVLNSLFGIKCSSVFMSTRLWLSLYIKVNLFFFRLVSNVSHFRSDNISVTLAVFCWSFEGKNEQLFFELSPRLKYLFL